MNQVTTTKTTTTVPAKRVPRTPPTACPIPTKAAAYIASTSDPTTGVATSLSVVATPMAMPAIVRAMNSTTLTSIPLPPAIAHRARLSGVASTISSRPDVSSDAQPDTMDAANRPARITPKSTNSSCRKPPAEA